MRDNYSNFVLGIAMIYVLFRSLCVYFIRALYIVGA